MAPTRNLNEFLTIQTPSASYTRTHSIEECNGFSKKPIAEKLETAKQHRACLRCLKTGHVAQKCDSKSVCTVVVGNNPCMEAHHPALHGADIKVALHTQGLMGGANRKSTILMACKVRCNGRQLTSILDPCATLPLITHRAAQKLNLIARPPLWRSPRWAIQQISPSLESM